MWILIVGAVLYLAYKLLPWYTNRLEKQNEKMRQEQKLREVESQAREEARKQAIHNMDLEPLIKRADEGDSECMHELASRYYLASGGVEEEDKARAYHYLVQLANRGDYTDGYFLGTIVQEGIPGKLEPDEAKAAEIFYRGALAGERFSKDSFASLTFKDPATVKYGHAEEAYRWLLELAEDDYDGFVDVKIGELFAAQNPVALKDPVTPEHALRESFTWMVRAADKGNAGAADQLALAFSTGDFLQYQKAIVPDLEKARKYASIVWNDPFIQLFFKNGKKLPYTNMFYAMALISQDDPAKMQLLLETGAENGNQYCIEALKNMDQRKSS